MSSRSYLCSQWIHRMIDNLPSRYMLRIYVVIFTNLFASGFTVALLYPYLPFMIEFLLPDLNDEKAVGRYVGFVAGGNYWGRVFGSYLWGIFSDRKGRKPVLIISSLLMGLFSLGFSFSVSLPMAVILRVLIGLSNGVVSVGKAVISESSCDSNQALGLSVFGVAWGAGSIAGPAISGAIADPIGQYNLNITNPFLHSFFTKFPYSLPPFVNFLLYLLSGVLTALLLPETLGSKKGEIRRTSVPSQDLKVTSEEQSLESTSSTLSQEEEEREEAMQVLVMKEEQEGEEEGKEGEKEEEREQGERETIQEIHSTRCSKYLSDFLTALKNLVLDLKLFFCNSVPLNAILIYNVFSFGAISFYEIFSLWAYTSPHLGGLGFSVREISICLIVVGVLVLPVSLAAFPLLEKLLHNIKTFYILGISLTFLFPMLPNLHYLVPIENTALLWFLLITIVFLIYAVLNVGFSSTYMFVNNSVPFDKLGSINGVAMTLSSITRAIGPITFGSLFSLSLSDATLDFGFPVDYNIVFVLLSVIFMATVFMVACLPVSGRNGEVNCRPGV